MKLEFQEIADESQKICEWLESFGFNVDPTRVARYRERLTQIAVNLENDTPEIINENLKPYLQALFEYGELSVLYQSFHENVPEGLHGLLMKLVSGPFSYIDENNKNSGPRNFAFEATLGARISMADLPVSFNYSGDVNSEIDGVSLYFQCKRLTSLKQTRTRLSKAAKQLRTDFKNHKGKMPLGFIAVDITKLNNPEGITMVAETTGEVEQQNVDFRHAFINDHIQDLKISGPKKLIGIVVRSAYLCFDKQTQAYTFNQGYTIANMGGISVFQRSISDRFHDALNRNSSPRRLTKR